MRWRDHPMWLSRYWLSRWLMSASLAVMPRGPYRDELRRRIYALRDEASIDALLE